MTDQQQSPTIVSSDSELLILVDSEDNETGQLAKLASHLGDGILHRAFSIFIFNDQGDVLLQKRAPEKFLWPMYWSNACCSHPRAGESMAEAVCRRLEQELGISTDLEYLYKFEYKARFGDLGTEHELCSVWIGKAEADAVHINPTEIAEWRFFSREALDAALKESPEQFTPWMKMEWERLNTEFSARLPG